MAKFFLNLTLVVSVLIALPRAANADPAREFILSCTYGVLAGTLVGAATLAFSDRPGDNLNRVARGASLGLYAGILLGAYIVYGVPSDDEEMPSRVDGQSEVSRPQASRMILYPLLSDRGEIHGAAANFKVLSF